MSLFPFVLEKPDGLRIAVRVTPGASRNAIGQGVALADDAAGGVRQALAVALAAPPVEGKANKALVAFLAHELGLAKRDVTLVAGMTGRVKKIDLRGNPTTLIAKLAALIGA
jgi:uncharacterized protein (TIGR00251 family)